MIKKLDENEIVYYSNNQDVTDIVEIFVNRDGNLYIKITCPKDRVVTLHVGKVDMPKGIKRIGKKIYRSHTSKWIADNIDMGSFILRYGAGNSYQISFKLFDRKFSRNGKFRLHDQGGTEIKMDE